MSGTDGKDSAHLREAVLATVAWFDVFGYPLTLPEIGRYLPVGKHSGGASLSDIAAALDSSGIGCVDGHYSLEGGVGDVGLRQRRYRLAKRKLVRARRAARVFGLLPSVRLVAVCNNLAVANAEDGSDIDLFVVCRPRTLWTTRLVLVGALKLFGLRPSPKIQKDKLCLSFWVSETEMDLSRYALPGGDPYMDYWIATLLPLYDAGGVFEKFRAVNGGRRDRRGKSIFQDDSSASAASFASVPSVPSVPSAPTLSEGGRGRIEAIARIIQMRKFPERIRGMANLDSRVVISDDVLKFHVNDRRAAYKEKFRERLDALDRKA